MWHTQYIVVAVTLVTLCAVSRAVEPAETVVPPAVAYVARPLPLSDVRLTDGPLKHAQDLDREYLLKLEPDRMLAYLRERAGLDQKATPYGGWDGEGRQLTGHIAGHYLSAVSYMYQASGDDRFKQRADYIVAQLKEVQDKRGTGYIGALLGNTGQPKRNEKPNLSDGELLFDQLTQGNIRSGGFDLNGMWSPWYVEHKIFAGLRDAYRMTGNHTALDVETKFADWVDKTVGQLTDAQAQKMLDTEFGGMSEVLIDLYADTGEKRWLTLAGQFHHKRVIDPLANGEDILAGKHGNTQIPKLLGSACEYLYTGNAQAGDAARHFWDYVVDHHSFVTGGHGYDEYFGKADQLSGQVDGTGQRIADLRTAESCNVYNMLKLTRRLFALQPDVRYADFQERALFNHVLASINPDNGAMCYMVPVSPGVSHEYQRMFEDFTCCVGTGMENHALHGDGIYYTSPQDDRMWVTIYTPSTAEWKSAGVKVNLETSLPLEGSAKLTVATQQPKEFTLSLRRPAWAGDQFAIAINGRPIEITSKADSFVDVTRTWKDGDVVALTLPLSLRTESLADNANRTALLYGPIVLAGDFGPGGRGNRRREDFPVFVHAGEALANWLKPVEGKPATFHATTADGRDMTLAPFYQSHDRRYGLYWDLFTPDQWKERQAKYTQQQDRQKQLAAGTVAFVQIGEMQPERDYHFQGEGSSAIHAEGQAGRNGGTWFSVDVPVDASKPTVLAVTLAARNAADPKIVVKVDGVTVEHPTHTDDPAAHFVDVRYAVPADAVSGKTTVTVRIEAMPGGELPGIYGLRVLRGEN